MKWKVYNYGPCKDFKCYDREGKPFSGVPEEFEKLHGFLRGLMNEETGEIILINQYYQAVATGNN